MKRISALLGRSLTWLWRGRHLLPVTPLGAALALMGWWLSASIGAQEVDYVVRTAGIVALGAVALALLLVLLASLRVWVTIRQLRRREGLEPLELETGRTGSTGLGLPALGGWPLLQLRVAWEEPSLAEVSLRRERGRFEELARPLVRGEADRINRRVLVEDIFGFARLGLPLVVLQKLRVVPSRAQVTAHVITRFLGGDALSHPSGPVEGEPIEMRRYVYGDPLRHVLWKAFARTRKLLVRTPERAITPRPSAVVYQVAGPGDEPTAGAARFFVEEGLLGKDLLFCADGSSTPTNDEAEALDQIVLSARARSRGALELYTFLGRLTANQLEACVLFVPPEPGAWLTRVEQVARQIPGARVITAVDRSPQEDSRGRIRRLLFADSDPTLRGMRGLGQVVQRLGACGFTVHVIHRPTGELLAPAQLEMLAGLKG